MAYIPKDKRIRQHVERRRHESHRYYDSHLWHNLRNYYIHNHPYCAVCESEGRVRLASEVHHKFSFMRGITEQERWQLLLDENNLISVCNECHKKIHTGKIKIKDEVTEESAGVTESVDGK